MNLTDYLSGLGARLAHLPIHTKVLLSVATGVLLVELALRRFAPRSKAYVRWKKGIEAVGAAWTAILLSVVYLVSVGPTNLFMRLMRKDLLDRSPGSDATFWKPHEANPLGPLAAARHQF